MGQLFSKKYMAEMDKHLLALSYGVVGDLDVAFGPIFKKPVIFR